MSPVSVNLTPEQKDDLVKTFLELSHDQKKGGRRMIAKAFKEVLPDSPHAAAFADVEADDKFEAFKREQEEKEVKRQQSEMIAQMNAKRSALLSGDAGRKYSEDDVKKIEDLMQKKGIVDYDDGATIYASTLPPADPKPGEAPMVHGARWEFPEFAKYAADPNKAANETATAMITDFMRKR